MANRNKSYDEVLSRKFDNLEYAQEYLLNVVESESCSLADAVRETIKAMGLQKFSNKSGLSIQAVSDFISQRQKWSTDKLIKYIEQVFKLKVNLTLGDSSSDQAAWYDMVF